MTSRLKTLWWTPINDNCHTPTYSFICIFKLYIANLLNNMEQSLPRSVMLLLCVLIATVFGDDIGDVVSYGNVINRPSYPKAGYIWRWECSSFDDDSGQCRNCDYAAKKSVHFGLCFRGRNGRYTMYTCQHG